MFLILKAIWPHAKQWLAKRGAAGSSERRSGAPEAFDDQVLPPHEIQNAWCCLERANKNQNPSKLKSTYKTMAFFPQKIFDILVLVLWISFDDTGSSKQLWEFLCIPQVTCIYVEKFVSRRFLGQAWQALGQCVRTCLFSLNWDIGDTL